MAESCEEIHQMDLSLMWRKVSNRCLHFITYVLFTILHYVNSTLIIIDIIIIITYYWGSAFSDRG